MRAKRSRRRINLKAIVTIVLLIFFGVFITNKFSILNERMNNLEKRLEETQAEETKLLKELTNINQKTEEIKRIEEERNELLRKHAEAIDTAKNGIDIHTDLVESTVALNGDDMNRIINAWTEHLATESLLRGHGDAFIVASQETGLNPIYLLAHAIAESGAGTSHLAMTKLNFFGINAIDTDPGQAYVMGEEVDEAIVNGAHWIKSNFYNNGYKTLAEMSDGGYATSPRWAMMINNIANEAIEYL